MLETLRNAWKITELRKKILYTLMIILIFRIGSFIYVPFIDPTILQNAANVGYEGIFSLLNTTSGGSLGTSSLFALGISPYITSSIVIQLLTVAIPALENLAKEGADGQKKIAKITRYTAGGLALLQSIAYYFLVRDQVHAVINYESLYANIFAAVVIVASFTAGAMGVVWLGEQIDRNGIGNGISIILFAGILSRIAGSVQQLAASFMSGQQILVIGMIVFTLVSITLIVLMTNAERRIPVQYAKRVVGRKMYGGQSSYIPIKVTMTGVMPVIFASSILALPALLQMFTGTESGLGKFLGYFSDDYAIYPILYLVLIIAFNYFYVAIQYDPMKMANDLRRNNGTINGVRPGQPTADYIGRVINKVTLVGALFIGVVCVIPIVVNLFLPEGNQLNLALSGTSVVIVVGVALDTVKQLESQMMMRHYKGFLE